MNRPLGDDERRTIDSQRVDAALASILETPLDQIDEAHLDELDRALTPEKVRTPIPVAKSHPPERPPTVATHHEVGHADDPDDDLFSPESWNSRHSVATQSHSTDSIDPQVADHTHNDHHDGRPSAPTTPRQQSTDPALNLSSGLRDLIDRRKHNGPPDPQSNEPVNRTGTTTESAPTDRGDTHPPASAHRTTVSEHAGTASAPAYDAPTHRNPPQMHDDAPIPLRSSQRSDTNGASPGALKALRIKLAGLDKSQRNKLTMVAALLAVLALFGTIRSCGSSTDDAASTGHQTATTIQTAAPQPTDDPIPDSAVGVLAPNTVSAQCPDGSTDERLAFSAEKGTAWICQRALGIDGAILEMTFTDPVVVTDVFLVPGFDYIEPSGIDRWLEHRVITRAQWTIGNQRFVQEINPSRAGAHMKIPAVETQTITLMVMETSEPTGNSIPRGLDFGVRNNQHGDSFAVSLIRITGHRP